MKKNNNLFSSTYQPKNKLIRSSLKVINYTDEELISLYKDLSKRINYERLNKINIKKEIITSSKKTYKYYFPKEIGGPDDYLGSTKLYYELNKIGLTVQIYYDLLILKINSPSDRPKCEICGKPVEFLNANVGYRTMCSLKCSTAKSNNGPRKPMNKYTMTDKERKRRSDYMRTRVVTKETRQKMSKSAINRIKRDKKHFENLIYSSRNSLKILKYKGIISKKTPKKSNTEFLCLSSYESHFLDVCDKNKFVKNIMLPEKIDYKFNGNDKVYIPDFKIELIEGTILIIEIKPYKFLNDPMVISKRIYGKKFCKEKGYKYITLSEKDIFKKSFLNFYDYII